MNLRRLIENNSLILDPDEEVRRIIEEGLVPWQEELLMQIGALYWDGRGISFLSDEALGMTLAELFGEE